jgi:signal transduction histidine kinase
VNAEQLKTLSDTTKKQLEILVHVVSHDIKQPITIARLHAELLLIKTKGNSRQHIKKLTEALESINTLTSDLSDTTKIANGDYTLQPEKIYLTQFLESVIAEEQITTTKHTILLDSPGGITGRWDRTRLKRVFVNVLSNAIKYSPDGGKIFVKVKKEKSYVSIAVKDPGVGMTKKESDALFQPFARQYKGKRKIKGTGLGLYISKSLVKAHRGEMWVKSKKGKGSTFFIELPL